MGSVEVQTEDNSLSLSKGGCFQFYLKLALLGEMVAEDEKNPL